MPQELVEEENGHKVSEDDSMPCKGVQVEAAARGAEALGAGASAAPWAEPSSAGAQPVELAVFDFDGTCISGNSPVILVKYLLANRRLRPSVASRILLWAAAYKFRLPQSESWVRGLVFTAFCGKPKDQIDGELADFYDKKVDRLFRFRAEEAMAAHVAAGRDVVVVSATFEPIVLRAMESHPFAHQVSTRMATDDQGNYTRNVEGMPVEGDEKLVAVKKYADEAYGEGNWDLTYAYGDHHSDRTLLFAARHAFAVTPDRPLERTARREGWDILDWS